MHNPPFLLPSQQIPKNAKSGRERMEVFFAKGGGWRGLEGRRRRLGWGGREGILLGRGEVWCGGRVVDISSASVYD